MQKFEYTCDRGGILIGNKVFNMLIPNDMGDGTWDVLVAEQNEKYEHIDRDYKYVGAVSGEFNIYKEDCLSLVADFIEPDNILCTLNGKYAVYTARGDYSGAILFLKQEEEPCTMKGYFGYKVKDAAELKRHQDKMIAANEKPAKIKPVARVRLDAKEWESFISDLLEDRSYIEKYTDENDVKDGVMYCTIVSCATDSRRIAVEAEGYNYPRYAALVI